MKKISIANKLWGGRVGDVVGIPQYTKTIENKSFFEIFSLLLEKTKKAKKYKYIRKKKLAMLAY